MAEPNKTVTYWDYLKLNQLLNLQSGNHEEESKISVDEMHFIVVHQVFELWFKLILSELRLVRDKMAADYVQEEMVPYAVHHLRRVTEILRVAAAHWKVVETLAPQDFLEFRSGLGTASGFQSYQLREVETLLGLEVEERGRYGNRDPLLVLLAAAEKSPHGDVIKSRLEAVQSEQSIRKALHNWLYRTPIHGALPGDPEDNKKVDKFLEEYIAIQTRTVEQHIQAVLADQGKEQEQTIRDRYVAGIRAGQEFLEAMDIPEDDERIRIKRVRAAVLFIESYRTLPLLSWPRLLLDTVAELEEQLILFRTHHARMVERVIGRRVGSGGSSGVDYLDSTTKYRIFPELWVVRTLLLPASVLPVLREPEMYGFAKK